MTHFGHSHVDDSSGTEQALDIGATSRAITITIRLEASNASCKTTFKLPRFRVKALHHTLGEWLESTKDQDE